MGAQLLVKVVTVTNLAGGGTTTLTHGLRDTRGPVAPTQVICDRASPLIVSAATTMTITVTNPTGSPLTANFRCEYDHSIHAVGATQVKWSGLPVTPATPVAIWGNFYSNVDQPIADNLTGTTTFVFEGGSGSGVSVVDPGTGQTRITVASAGVYAFTLSPQLFKSAGAGQATVSFWLRKGGTNVPETASFVAVTNNEHMLPFVEVILPMNAGEYVEWVGHASTINVTVEHEPESFAPAIVRPAGPSIITTVKYLGV